MSLLVIPTNTPFNDPLTGSISFAFNPINEVNFISKDTSPQNNSNQNLFFQINPNSYISFGVFISFFITVSNPDSSGGTFHIDYILSPNLLQEITAFTLPSFSTGSTLSFRLDGSDEAKGVDSSNQNGWDTTQTINPTDVFPQFRLYRKIDPIDTNPQELIWSSDDVGGLAVNSGWFPQQANGAFLPVIIDIKETENYSQTLEMDILGTNFTPLNEIKVNNVQLVFDPLKVTSNKITVPLPLIFSSLDTQLDFVATTDVGDSNVFSIQTNPPTVIINTILDIKVSEGETITLILDGTGFAENGFINPDAGGLGGVILIDQKFLSPTSFLMVLFVEPLAEPGFRDFLFRQHGSPGITEIIIPNYLEIAAKPKGQFTNSLGTFIDPEQAAVLNMITFLKANFMEYRDTYDFDPNNSLDFTFEPIVKFWNDLRLQNFVPDKEKTRVMILPEFPFLEDAQFPLIIVKANVQTIQNLGFGGVAGWTQDGKRTIYSSNAILNYTLTCSAESDIEARRLIGAVQFYLIRARDNTDTRLRDLGISLDLNNNPSNPSSSVEPGQNTREKIYSWQMSAKGIAGVIYDIPAASGPSIIEGNLNFLLSNSKISKAWTTE